MRFMICWTFQCFHYALAINRETCAYHTCISNYFFTLFVVELTANHSRHVFNRKFDGAGELFVCWITLDFQSRHGEVNNFCRQINFQLFGTDNFQAKHRHEKCLNTGCQNSFWVSTEVEFIFTHSRFISSDKSSRFHRCRSPHDFHFSHMFVLDIKAISDDSSHQVFVCDLFIFS